MITTSSPLKKITREHEGHAILIWRMRSWPSAECHEEGIVRVKVVR
jgi:hypothetical protein